MNTRINSSESGLRKLCIQVLVDMAKANSIIHEVVKTVADSMRTVGRKELANIDILVERIEKVAEAHKLTSQRINYAVEKLSERTTYDTTQSNILAVVQSVDNRFVRHIGNVRKILSIHNNAESRERADLHY